MRASHTTLNTSEVLFSNGTSEKDLDCCAAPRHEVVETIAKRFKNFSRSLGPKKDKPSKRSSGSVRKRKGDSLTFTCLGLPTDVSIPETTKKFPQSTCMEVGDICKATDTIAQKSILSCGFEKTTIDTTWTTTATHSQSKGPAHAALQSVFESLAPPAIALNVSRGLQGSGILLQGSRSAHIQLTPALQRGVPGNTKQLQNRLLFICACMSLASDLQAFEKRQGKRLEGHRAEDHRPHGRLLLSAPNSQNQTFQSFVASEARNGIDEKQIIIALNFGKKLQIIEAISNSLGLGSGLAVLLGYECVSLSQLTYRAIATLRREIGPDAELCNRIRAFSTVVDDTWNEFRENYHRDHRRYVDQEDEDNRSSSDNISIIISAPYRRSLGGQGTCRYLPPLCRRPSQRFSAPIIFLDESRAYAPPPAQALHQPIIPQDLDRRIGELPAMGEVPAEHQEQTKASLETPTPVMHKTTSVQVRCAEEKQLPKTPDDVTTTRTSIGIARVEETRQCLESPASVTQQQPSAEMNCLQETQQSLETPAPVAQKRTSLDTKRLRSTYFWGNAGELGLYTALFEFEDRQSFVPTDNRSAEQSYMSMVRAASQIRRDRKAVGRPGSRRRDGRVFMLAPMASSAKRKRDPSYFWGNVAGQAAVASQNPPDKAPAFPAIQLKCKEASHEASSWTDASSVDSVDDALEALLQSLQNRCSTSVVLDAADAYSMKRQRRVTKTVGVAQ